MMILAAFTTSVTVGMIIRLIILDTKKLDRQIEIKSKKDNYMNKIDQTINDIIENVCISSGLTVEEIKMKSRKREIAVPRQVATYKIKEAFGDRLTWRFIGEQFNQDHATAMHSYKEVNKGIETNDGLITSILENYENSTNRID